LDALRLIAESTVTVAPVERRLSVTTQVFA